MRPIGLIADILPDIAEGAHVRHFLAEFCPRPGTFTDEIRRFKKSKMGPTGPKRYDVEGDCLQTSVL